MATRKKKEKKKACAWIQVYNRLKRSGCRLKVAGCTMCAADLLYMCVLPFSFGFYIVITWMSPTAGLFPSSTLSLSHQVFDFMYNYLHNYSSHHPTVSGGLFLCLWCRLSFIFQTHTQGCTSVLWTQTETPNQTLIPTQTTTSGFSLYHCFKPNQDIRNTFFAASGPAFSAHEDCRPDKWSVYVRKRVQTITHTATGVLTPSPLCRLL